ncbi:uncharacterized protein LOC109851722 [Pseudomyrmex gracilis]|uniref:uncharacterized protein LOC109851722 n=1 Tax=Pseudomyrmex gracilis TaxID=219809 RepID=UPI000995A426|nr:uncharacterized protein LOC109851722 [Pseudomyrmex gracilis]XP_020277656.1 uncharacterized protein LOC109851722 [Pseudomyrmex gracilis]XP_020277657.1 uncharacterized protein LOC109851722 [Pseudomyrmex gracilis]XP_020277658.1 uncharacterized protein LOC109851722 [Pseudomyrmex gracilis]XP_020277659.1 uncharacterized protein LOC109851722 [Pseudomyrmex gracilis]
MDLKAVVVSGEAPESDDDGSIVTGLGFPTTRTPSTYCGTIISGEAPESDDDLTSLSSVSGAVDAMACPPYTDLKIPKSKKSSIKYNSLLHKKLHECNETLDRNILQVTEGVIATNVQELSAVNRQLLRSELVLQEAVCQLRNASTRVKDTSNALRQLIDDNFLHSIKT